MERAIKEGNCEQPVVLSTASLGFYASMHNEADGKLDLNEQLVPRPSATVMVRANGDSMAGVGIFSGDMLIVDRSVPAKHGSIIIAMIDAKLMVKRLFMRKGVVKLEAANRAYPSINMCDDTDLWCWGVVTATVRQYAGSVNARSLKSC